MERTTNIAAMKVSDYPKIYAKAWEYLLSFAEIDTSIINKHLDEYKEDNPESMEDVLYVILESVKNRQGMPKAIGRIENIEPCLCDYSATRITEEYNSNWKKLFRTVKSKCKPPGRMLIDNPHNYWVIFCKAIISASKFVSRFSDIEEFNTFVKAFYLNEYTRVALPLLLEKEIFGMRFALACDFLKENGYPKFVKPDVHIKAIFNGLGISNSESDYEIFKDVIRFSETIGELPYKVDKLFWLIGSGDFYLVYDKRISTNRDEFIERTRKQLLS